MHHTDAWGHLGIRWRSCGKQRAHAILLPQVCMHFTRLRALLRHTCTEPVHACLSFTLLGPGFILVS